MVTIGRIAWSSKAARGAPFGDRTSGEYFGRSLALWGDRLIIGAPGDEAPGGATFTGVMYAYGGVEGGRTVQTWNLDAVGNWSATAVNGVWQERNVNSGNEIISLEGADDTTDKNIAHDPAGNMTTMPRLPMPGYAPGRLLCQYDAWGRLAAVWDDTSTAGDNAGRLDSPGDTLLAEYQYDPASQDGLRGAGSLGRRTAKIVREGAGDTWKRTDYYYDESWRVVEECATAGAVSYASAAEAGAAATVADEIVYAQYLYDPGRGDTPICRFRDADGDYGQEGGNGLEETLFYLTDANGNVTALVRPDGTVMERYMYDAYGQVHVLNGDATIDPDRTYDENGDPHPMDQWTLDPDNKSDWANAFQFSGYYLDFETGLYQARNRYYHSVLGSWITRDPAGFIDGMNLTAYCGGNPINATDPTGLWTWSDVLDPFGVAPVAAPYILRAAEVTAEIDMAVLKKAVDTAGKVFKADNAILGAALSGNPAKIAAVYLGAPSGIREGGCDWVTGILDTPGSLIDLSGYINEKSAYVLTGEHVDLGWLTRAQRTAFELTAFPNGTPAQLREAVRVLDTTADHYVAGVVGVGLDEYTYEQTRWLANLETQWCIEVGLTIGGFALGGELSAIGRLGAEAPMLQEVGVAGRAMRFGEILAGEGRVLTPVRGVRSVKPVTSGLDAAFQELRTFRSKLGGIPAKGGRLPDGGTLARLDSGGGSFYGMSAHGQPTLIGNGFTRTHAEIDALQQAFMAGKIEPSAVMYVDNNLCQFCQSGLPRTLMDLEMQQLIIHTPVNSWRVTQSGTTMIAR